MGPVTRRSLGKLKVNDKKERSKRQRGPRPKALEGRKIRLQVSELHYICEHELIRLSAD